MRHWPFFLHWTLWNVASWCRYWEPAKLNSSATMYCFSLRKPVDRTFLSGQTAYRNGEVTPMQWCRGYLQVKIEFAYNSLEDLTSISSKSVSCKTWNRHDGNGSNICKRLSRSKRRRRLLFLSWILAGYVYYKYSEQRQKNWFRWFFAKVGNSVHKTIIRIQQTWVTVSFAQTQSYENISTKELSIPYVNCLAGDGWMKHRKNSKKNWCFCDACSLLPWSSLTENRRVQIKHQCVLGIFKGQFTLHYN